MLVRAISAPESDPDNAHRESGSPGRGIAFLWIGTATVTGAIVMAMELTAFRLYAPYFGNTIYVWGSMISVVMLALAVGYALGGWAADRWPSDAVLHSIILASGIYQLGIVFVVRSTLVWLWESGDFRGPVLATFIIFVPPMMALAMTSPLVVRLLVRAGHVGAAVGSVFALSTAGSIAGVLATSFYLVPRLGTRRTLELLCALSIVTGVAGLTLRRRSALVFAVLPVFLLFTPHPKPAASILWSADSVYNRITVIQKEGFRWLALNDPRYFQTIEKVGSTSSGYYLDEFALGPVIVSAKKLLVLGMGAGRSIEVSWAVAPELEIEAVEIDPLVVRVGTEFFGLPQNDSRLQIHIADARPWLVQHTAKSSLVHIDLFQGGPYVPFYLTTVEFFRLVRSRMADEGALILNVYDVSPRHELLHAVGATLRQVFPSLELVSRADGNHTIFAFARTRPLAESVSLLKQFKGAPWVQELAQTASSKIADFEPPPDALVFTDDRAPIEEMTRRMLVYARS